MGVASYYAPLLLKTSTAGVKFAGVMESGLLNGSQCVSRIIQTQRPIVKYLLHVVEHVSENDLPALNTHSEFL
jgi:hypothetical protein